MPLLLLSLGSGAVTDFVARHTALPAAGTRLGYLADAARPHADAPFVIAEREKIAGLGFQVAVLPPADSVDAGVFADALDAVDAVYVAGGNVFVLLAALRARGADEVLVEKVRAGLPYVGCSAGSVVAGPSIEPLTPMDDPADAPGLASTDGLGLVDTVVVPHADGLLPPYPLELIAQIKRTYDDAYPLTFLTDARGLLVEDGTPRVVASP
ncbi:Type 1 glutamine amidotransferase-like domain-containing protein [Nocardioides bruguierae]|uniref:Type 1 glutamine amidotransferase-like domain-containing protein n=1 Tax=Nocardioides bruguierae TaxID=2945102 RepID=A0A9X2ID24_9ACTN|nr:Type 1 glutamine amidotransferase-like domain-containing protein [Nocardioides bruguierae]MCM0619296.1 Type 1 glutamine amidotransferase-like domain-containing protein [Nocardioides bruguierae]